MTIDGIQKQLEKQFGAVVGPVTPGRPDSWIEVDADKIAEVTDVLKSGLELAFDCLSNLSGVDYPAQNRIQLVYNLFSYELRHEVTIKVNTDRANPQVPTVEKVWPAANWLEREVWDMFGIVFRGHPNLKRILMYEEFEGHPLRKDYPVNKRQPLIGPEN